MRLFYCLAQINAIYESNQISRSLFNLSDNDIVVNLTMIIILRNLFPNNKIITVINDDFIAQARFFKGKHVQKSLEKVCSFSDAVFNGFLSIAQSSKVNGQIKLFYFYHGLKPDTNLLSLIPIEMLYYYGLILIK